MLGLTTVWLATIVSTFAVSSITHDDTFYKPNKGLGIIIIIIT